VASGRTVQPRHQARGLAEYGIYPDKLNMKEGLRKQLITFLATQASPYYGNVRSGGAT
jgi:hypothetical protein